MALRAWIYIWAVLALGGLLGVLSVLAPEAEQMPWVAWLVLTASYYERFLDHPDQAPERAAFFRDLLEGRGGFAVAARFRQEGWRRPSAEFLDPEIVVLRRTSGDQLPMR